MSLKFKTNGFNCYNVQYCPQIPNRFGCVSSQNFGIGGSGALFLVDIIDTEFGPEVRCHRVYYWNSDPLYDLSWSESHPNILWTVSANGFIQVWDSYQANDAPVNAFKGHEREIYSVNWSQNPESNFALTTSSDTSIKIWDVLTMQSINTYLGHNNIVYCGQWSPFIDKTFATASGDSTLRIWSLEQSEPTLEIRASFGEVLSCDWNKFNQFIVTTSDTNGLINIWDIRSAMKPVVTFCGHSKAIRNVKFSPFRETIIGSVSYDKTTRLWDTNEINGLLFTSQEHKEFVYGLDFNRHFVDQIADCSWDQFVHIFSYSAQNKLKNHL